MTTVQDPFKTSLEAIRKRGEDLQRSLHDLSLGMHEHFAVPNEWPTIVDKFVVLARTQYQTLQEELNGSLLSEKEYLLKPISLVGLKDEQAIPELLRTKVEPEIEKEQKELVEEFYNSENLGEDYDENIQNLKKTTDAWNKCVEDLTQNFEQIKNDVLVKSERDLLSPKVVMTDVTSQLVDYYFAVTLGKGLTANAEIESSALAEEVHTPVTKPKELTPLEQQNKLFAESRQKLSNKMAAPPVAPPVVQTPTPMPNNPSVPPPVRLGSSRNIPINVGPVANTTPITPMYAATAANRFQYQQSYLLNPTQPPIYRSATPVRYPAPTPPPQQPQQNQPPRGFM